MDGQISLLLKSEVPKSEVWNSAVSLLLPGMLMLSRTLGGLFPNLEEGLSGGSSSILTSMLSRGPWVLAANWDLYREWRWIGSIASWRFELLWCLVSSKISWANDDLNMFVCLFMLWAAVSPFRIALTNHRGNHVTSHTIPGAHGLPSSEQLKPGTPRPGPACATLARRAACLPASRNHQLLIHSVDRILIELSV